MSADSKQAEAHERRRPDVFRGLEFQDRPIERQQSLWRRNRLKIALLSAVAAIGIALVIALFQFAGAGASVARDRLTIATVQRGPFVRDIIADGQVVAAVSPTLYASGPGTVTLNARAGDTASKGQILAVIDSPDLLARVAQEEQVLQSLRNDEERSRLEAERQLALLRATYEGAEVDQKTAEREVERSRKAYESGAYAELQVRRLEDALEKAQFASKQAKSAYDSYPKLSRFELASRKALVERQQFLVADLHRQLDALQVHSPVDGVVAQVMVANKASVAHDTVLMSVVDLSALEVEIKVPETQARELASGMRADIDGAGGHWSGRVSAVSPEVLNGEVVARVRFDGTAPKGLRQSERLTVRIALDSRDSVLTVDRGSFVEQGGGYAYVVTGNIAERRAVRLGATSVQKVEILQGLKPGERVVISGAEAFNGAARAILAR